ncbi:MAG: polysaccharide deacetylase family protein, partial [Thermodesulfovibrionia bacterium]|nr:polysaccharide deacetylase family protein [Thermodesulfovibrionia bacterium]
YLRWAKFEVISLEEMVSRLWQGREFSRRTVVITFDDGFCDIYKNAWPILQKYGFPAAIFVVSGFVDKTNEWVKREGMPQRRLVSWEELLEMSRSGIEVGSHTVTHKALRAVNTQTLSYEIRSSKNEIEDHLGKPVRFFAYPYGLLDKAARAVVADAGYEAACSTRSGFNNTEVDPFILRRIEIYGTDSLYRYALKIAWGTNDASLSLIVRYFLSRIQDRFRRLISVWT